VFEKITKENWLMFALKNYENPTLEKEAEFYDDLKRFKYLKRLFRKYKMTGDIKVRLVINHIIILTNVFTVEAAITLLLFKIDREYWSILKPVLEYLSYLYPEDLNYVIADNKVKRLLEEL
jgi:hypothetical protein|tara:strand:- start:698 stop:1060 length:363 start_codon:yes stop_codon:yes gene_type:complete